MWRVVVLALMLWSALASAECAWVLWSEMYGDGTGPIWLRLDAHDSRPACIDAAKSLAKRKGANRPEVKVRDGIIFYPNKTEEWLVCWPDTIDPRTK